MIRYWISAQTVFDGKTLWPDHAILVENGRVAALKKTTDINPDQIASHHACILMPGFFDIQVNGGGGALLNSDPTPQGMATISAAHRTYGTVALLPTVITDAPDVLEKAADACLVSHGQGGIAGLHIEGPHISSVRRGTHADRYIRQMDSATMAVVRQLRVADVPVLITVAPETTTTEQINQLRDMGAVVSIGHSDSTAEITKSAVNAGATCFTHLFNAMSPMLHRAPGVTGAAIASKAWCSIIADGLHVDPTMIAIAIRARPLPDRMIAISDAMSTVAGPDTFDLYGQRIRLKDGRLINAEGSLAGAHHTLLWALRNLVEYGVALDDALRMCRHNPAQLMGLWPQMALVGCDVSDILSLTDKLALVSVGLDIPAHPNQQMVKGI